MFSYCCQNIESKKVTDPKNPKLALEKGAKFENDNILETLNKFENSIKEKNSNIINESLIEQSLNQLSKKVYKIVENSPLQKMIYGLNYAWKNKEMTLFWNLLKKHYRYVETNKANLLDLKQHFKKDFPQIYLQGLARSKKDFKILHKIFKYFPSSVEYTYKLFNYEILIDEKQENCLSIAIEKFKTAESKDKNYYENLIKFFINHGAIPSEETLEKLRQLGITHAKNYNSTTKNYGLNITSIFRHPHLLNEIVKLNKINPSILLIGAGVLLKNEKLPDWTADTSPQYAEFCQMYNSKNIFVWDINQIKKALLKTIHSMDNYRKIWFDGYFKHPSIYSYFLPNNFEIFLKKKSESQNVNFLQTNAIDLLSNQNTLNEKIKRKFDLIIATKIFTTQYTGIKNEDMYKTNILPNLVYLLNENGSLFIDLKGLIHIIGDVSQAIDNLGEKITFHKIMLNNNYEEEQWSEFMNIATTTDNILELRKNTH